jgi:hypothetical protein
MNDTHIDEMHSKEMIERLGKHGSMAWHVAEHDTIYFIEQAAAALAYAYTIIMRPRRVCQYLHRPIHQTLGLTETSSTLYSNLVPHKLIHAIWTLAFCHICLFTLGPVQLLLRLVECIKSRAQRVFQRAHVTIRM